MESEIINLQKRVAELEAALAAVSRESRQPKLRQGTALVPLIYAGILAICVGILLVRGAGQPVTAQGGSKGPSRVTAPFEVVNGAGKTLFTVGASQQGSQLELHNDAGTTLFGVGSAEHGTTLELHNEIGQKVAVLGTLPNSGDGALHLLHNGEESLYLGRTTVGPTLEEYNAGKSVVTLQQNGWGGGNLVLRNGGGKDVAAIFSEQGQTGILQLFNNGGQERVTMGTLRETGKGDVCASGDKGQVCLRFIRPGY
jgi:hypothetical protein